MPAHLKDAFRETGIRTHILHTFQSRIIMKEKENKAAKSADIKFRNLIDLHVHLDGSLPMHTARRLMTEEENASLSDAALHTLLSVPEDCRSLNDYLARFDFPLHLLQTPEAAAICTEDVLTEQKKQGLIYTELRFAPQSLTRKGYTQKEILEGALAGLNHFLSGQDGSDAPLHASLILCAMRGSGNEKENLRTLELAAEFLSRGVCGFDLAGAEALFPTENYEDLFRTAREMQVPFTIHAGEAAGPGSIRSALSFGAARIGHGIRCTEDPALMDLLAARGIPLEICPTSNLNTRIFPDLSVYPLRKLMDAGIRITINTDNMAVSDTTEPREFAGIAAALELTEAECRSFLMNAAEAAFAPQKEKERLMALLTSTAL